MAKPIPLGSMAFGQITLNEENLGYALKENGDSEELKNWINKALAYYSKKYNAGHYLIFIKLNPRSTKLSLRLDLDKYEDENGNISVPDNLCSLLGY